MSRSQLSRQTSGQTSQVEGSDAGYTRGTAMRYKAYTWQTDNWKHPEASLPRQLDWLNCAVMAQKHWIHLLSGVGDHSKCIKKTNQGWSVMETRTSHPCWQIPTADLTHDLACALLQILEIIIRHHQKKKLMMALRIFLATFGMWYFSRGKMSRKPFHYIMKARVL